MKKTIFLFFSIVLLITLWGCSPTISSPSITYTPVKLTPSKTETITPTLTPEATFTPTPGPNASLLFLANGSIQKYSLQTWSLENLSIQSDGEIMQAALSSDQQWLAYKDSGGLKIIQSPFENHSVISLANGETNRISFAFSSDSAMIAYSDEQGMWLYDISKNIRSLILPHVVDESDVGKIRVYHPAVWSPDNQWLWVDVGRWEGHSRTLVHMPTQKVHEFSGCYSGVDWLPNASAFVATVIYNDYLGCGEKYGIYLISIDGKNIIEKHVYHGNSTTEPYLHKFSDPKFNRQMNTIAFVQLSYPSSNAESSRLILTNFQGDQVQEIDSGSGEIATPIWSTNGEVLFYTIRDKRTSRIFSLHMNSFEKTQIGTLPDNAALLSLLPNDNWMVVGTFSKFSNNWLELFLFNVTDGTTLQISDLNYYYFIEPYLGLMANH